MTHRERMLTVGLAAALVLATVAGAAAYINRDGAGSVSVSERTLDRTQPKAQVKVARAKDLPWKGQQQVAAAQPQCNDGNVLGYAAGGIAGGLVGSQIGSGNGRTAATIGGALGGAYLGGQAIPLRNATCR